MPELSTLLIFAAASFAIAIVPGPAVLYIVARSINQGRLAGIVSMLGIEFANFFHIAAAAFGLSALLMSSAIAFSIIKYLGAAYLIYLGIRTLLTREEVQPNRPVESDSLKRIFFQGVVVNILNPKVALFYFAFLPQFVDRSQDSAVSQILILGCLFVAIATVSDGLYALIAGSIGQWLRGNLRFLRAQRYFSGSVYLGLGLTTAFAGSSKD
ncbi:LysE family translocator [Microcoleus sp. FACHB-1515]|uniref:LysE family translocator n=1 Tax=Cyanophyceae TaxID=3028117 RepID=UPI001686C1E1|nr:LysE family translocator [Microcoleus sp. FACHB-1515]MBD2090265.1 LysE family translocator [Microcoleus sp. FACHB-1515]